DRGVEAGRRDHDGAHALLVLALLGALAGLLGERGLLLLEPAQARLRDPAIGVVLRRRAAGDRVANLGGQVVDLADRVIELELALPGALLGTLLIGGRAVAGLGGGDGLAVALVSEPGH